MRTSSDYIIIIIIIIITSVKLYKIKYIYYKNQAQLQKAGQQKMIKTNNGIYIKKFKNS